ncbi:MAG: hypothetical protein ACYSSO_13045 [Planctomycetota bacterium]|jgi:type II secretory ATPase GspE/PulE/Tfp pilus assembly ATPase PilB-like protein
MLGILIITAVLSRYFSNLVNYFARTHFELKYNGRTIITERFLSSEKIRDMIIARRYSNETDAQDIKEGMTFPFLSCMDKVARGILTYQEVLSTTKGTILVN